MYTTIRKGHPNGCPFLAEREALEPMLSRNIIKLQITDNHILSKAQSKSKSF